MKEDSKETWARIGSNCFRSNDGMPKVRLYDGQAGVALISVDENTIVRFVRENSVGEHLIAAAPDLYEALREACEIIEDLTHFANNNGGMIDEPRFTAGLAALAKARGE